MSLLLTIAAALAAPSTTTPLAGVEWRPLSRADLGWIVDDRDSGVAVGEFDGSVRPALFAYGGAWVGDRAAVIGTLGIARLTNTTEVDTVIRQRHWGVIRPGVDLRFALIEPRDRVPLPWLLIGGHADIPSARDVSTGYTRDEQKVADEQAFVERASLGGVGTRAGLGAEIEVQPGLTLGAQWTVGWQVATWRADDLDQTSSWVAADASILLGFRWPPPGDLRQAD